MRCEAEGLAADFIAKRRDEAEAKDELENDEAEKTEATGREAKTELKE